MHKILSFLNHRDFVLSLALITGLLLGERSRPLAEISLPVLAFVMVFATTGFSFKSWIPFGNALKTLIWSTVVNFIVFGLVLIGLSYWVFGNESYFPYYVGFVLVAAAPPGPSVIPFSTMLKGDTGFSVTGVFGLHFVAMIITPVFLLLFLGQSLINPAAIFEIMVKIIVIPLIISRFLRHKKTLPWVQKHRDTIVKWGFFFVIVPIMGMSSSVFFAEPRIVLMMSGILLLSMYVLGFIYHIIMLRWGFNKAKVISSTFMMTTKSSAFSAVAAFTFFSGEPMIALPSAVVSVFVTLFIIVYGAFLKRFSRA